MRFIIIILLVLAASGESFCQSDSTVVGVYNDSTVFQTVQVEAQFPGGLPGWKKYLEVNLKTEFADSCIIIPKGQKMAKQTVIVSFKVDQQGKISDVKAENAAQVCPKLAEEAIRVIKRGPRWIPATQNGRNVIYRQKQSITWVLTED